MTKDELVKIGLAEEQAVKVLELQKSELTNYIPKHRFDEVNEELKTTKQIVADRDNQISSLKKVEGASEELKQKIAELENANKEKQKAFDEQINKTRAEAAAKLDLAATKGKPHDIDMVLGMIDLSKVVIEDGKVKSGLKEQVENIRKEKPFLFETQQSGNQNNFSIKGNPNEGNEHNGSNYENNGNDMVSLAKSLAKGSSTASISNQVNDVYFNVK